MPGDCLRGAERRLGRARGRWRRAADGRSGVGERRLNITVWLSDARGSSPTTVSRRAPVAMAPRRQWPFNSTTAPPSPCCPGDRAIIEPAERALAAASNSSRCRPTASTDSRRSTWSATECPMKRAWLLRHHERPRQPDAGDGDRAGVALRPPKAGSAEIVTPSWELVYRCFYVGHVGEPGEPPPATVFRLAATGRSKTSESRTRRDRRFAEVEQPRLSWIVQKQNGLSFDLPFAPFEPAHHRWPARSIELPGARTDIRHQPQSSRAGHDPQYGFGYALIPTVRADFIPPCRTVRFRLISDGEIRARCRS